MNYRWIIAVIILGLSIGGFYFGTHSSTQIALSDKKIEHPSTVPHGIGIIDIEKIRTISPEGEQITSLCAQELRLRLELNELMRVVELPKSPTPITPPVNFAEVAWHKNAQIVTSKLAELENRKKILAEEYRKKSEPQYIAERNRIRDEYLNENLNIQLKLQNADNLHLKKEKIDELLKRLDEIEFERNNSQNILLDKWMSEINQYVNDAIAEDEKNLRREIDELQAQVTAQEQQKELDINNRNQQIIQDALKEMSQRKIRRQEIFTELQKVSKERSELEHKFLSSIVDKTAMLATLHRLEIVLVQRAPDEEIALKPIKWNFEFNPPKRVGTVIISGKDVVNLTDELIKEINRP